MGFRLPVDVTYEKTLLPNGVPAFVFRHRTLGELGRLVLQETTDGRTLISCELSEDPNDPMTEKRAAIFKPIGLDISRRMAEATHTPENPPPATVSPRMPDAPDEVVESKLFPCEQCNKTVAMLIFAPGATDTGQFEDYARRMYRQIRDLNAPTWIIGPAFGTGPHDPVDILKVWPERETIQRLRPDEFNPLLDQLIDGHCR